MHRPPAWFARKFEFTFPVEQHANLCVRLRGAPARLEEMVRGADREILIRRPEAEQWSAQEHAGHMLDLESLWMARVGDYLAGAEKLTAADLSNRKTFEADHNQRPMEEILGEFRRARLQLVSAAEKIDGAIFGRAMIHPRLQTPMRLVDFRPSSRER